MTNEISVSTNIISLLLMITITVLAFIMYAKREKHCDPHMNGILAISDWLLGVGLLMVIPAGLILLSIILVNVSPTISAMLLGITTVLTPIAWSIWFII